MQNKTKNWLDNDEKYQHGSFRWVVVSFVFFPPWFCLRLGASLLGLRLHLWRHCLRGNYREYQKMFVYCRSCLFFCFLFIFFSCSFLFLNGIIGVTGRLFLFVFVFWKSFVKRVVVYVFSIFISRLSNNLNFMRQRDNWIKDNYWFNKNIFSATCHFDDLYSLQLEPEQSCHQRSRRISQFWGKLLLAWIN